jgi:hypothetical protein
MMFEFHKPVNCPGGRLLPEAAGSAPSFFGLVMSVPTSAMAPEMAKSLDEDSTTSFQ